MVTIERAFTAVGVACRPPDLMRHGAQAHARLLTQGRAILRQDPNQPGLFVAHQSLLPVAVLPGSGRMRRVGLVLRKRDVGSRWRPSWGAGRRLMRGAGVRAVAISISGPLRFGIPLTSADTYLPACCHISVRQSTASALPLAQPLLERLPSPYPDSSMSAFVSRDWGFAGDYVRAMWIMLQQDEPEDYVIATGQSHSVRDLLQVAFQHVEIDDWRPYVVQEARFFRRADVAVLVGDASKARAKLGWQPMVGLQQVIEMIVDADLENEKRSHGSAREVTATSTRALS